MWKAHRGLAGVLVSGLVLLACLAHAETPAPGPAGAPKLPEPLTREAIRDLVARLGETEVRQLLIAQLDRAAAPPSAAGPDMMGMADHMEGHSQRVRARAGELLRGAAALPSVLGEVRERYLEGRGPGHLALVALFFVVMLAAGFLVERLFERAVGGVCRGLDEAPAAGLGAQAARLLLRLALDILGLVAFVAGALAIFFAFHQGHQPTRRIVLTYLLAIVVVRLVALVAGLLLAPAAPARRLLPFDDAAVRRLHTGLVALSAVYAFGKGTILVLAGLGAPDATVDALNLGLSALFLIVALATVWSVRADVAHLIRGPGEAGPRRLLADLWPVLAAAYLVLVFVAHVAQLLGVGPPLAGAAILSIVLVLALPLVDLALGRILTALVSGRPAPGGAGAHDARATFEPVLRRAIHVVVVVIGLLVLADLWNLNVFNLAERGLGGRVAGALLGIAVTLLVAWIIWELARTAIDRQLALEQATGGERGEEGGAPASRLRTLLPLVRMLLLGAILVMGTLSILSALGVNILPLLAGAGVFGLAIGFGSQTLVRDIVSGAFFLMDDAFRLGEYIEAGDSKGTVEKIGIRSLQIRHHRGALNILPYGEIKRLRNTSRDWMIMVMEFGLAYDTDLVKVKKIIKRIGEELAADPELGPEMLQPLKSQGVTATDDAGLLVRAKFMAKPGSAPYLIRREAYTRILKAFAADGIRFSTRAVTVLAPPGAPPAAVAGASAAVADGGRGLAPTG